jgi:hypothetical protein
MVSSTDAITYRTSCREVSSSGQLWPGLSFTVLGSSWPTSRREVSTPRIRIGFVNS